jgi:hypothetical protein
VLLGEPLLWADILYAVEVFVEVQMVVGNMPEVKFFEIGTWIIAALKAEHELIFSQQCTIFLRPRTLFVLYPAPLAAMLQLFHGQQSLFACQKMTARSAINSI